METFTSANFSSDVKLLDVMNTLCRCFKKRDTSSLIHDLIEENQDLIGMAMHYFEDFIRPKYRHCKYGRAKSSTSSSSSVQIESLRSAYSLDGSEENVTESIIGVVSSSQQQKPTIQSNSITFAHLPFALQARIFDSFTYKELTQIRAICHDFYDLSGVRLNRGFRRLHSEIPRFIQEIENELPRTPSKRRTVSERDWPSSDSHQCAFLFSIRLTLFMLESNPCTTVCPV